LERRDLGGGRADGGEMKFMGRLRSGAGSR
jgi:hypothetical protein